MTPPGRPALFAGVDRAVFATSLAARLRRAGVEVSFGAVERCTAALGAVGPIDLDDLYWLTRVSYLHSESQLATFDAVFDAIFRSDPGRLPADRRGAMSGSPEDRLHRVGVSRTTAVSEASTGLPWATLPSVATDTGDEHDGGDAAALPELRPSPAAVDPDRPFHQLDDAELARVGVLVDLATRRWPHRPTRRRRPTTAKGSVALRRAVRGALRTGGEVVELSRDRPRTVPRRLVVLLDVSASMEVHARAYLHLIRPLALRDRAEVFVFATRLTRITPSIRLRSPAEAVDHVSRSVGDRFAGTRIASSVRALTQHPRWGTMTRNAVVLICSDGWDTDDPDDMGRAMARLSRMAHRVVWVNPRSAADGFQPLTGGMAAALPHCDGFLAGTTARALSDVVDALVAP